MPRRKGEKVARVCKVCGAGYMSWPWGGLTCSPKCSSRKAQESYCVEITMSAGQSAAYMDLAVQAETAPPYLRAIYRRQMEEIRKAAKPMRGEYVK